MFYILYQAVRIAKPDKGATLRNRMINALSLTRWALSRKSSFPERISGIFHKNSGLVPPPFSRERHEADTADSSYTIC